MNASPSPSLPTPTPARTPTVGDGCEPTTALGPALRIERLSVSFPGAGNESRSRSGALARRFAVRDVSMSVYPGQTLAIVGESGSGKSVTAMSVLRLLPTPPAAYERGAIMLDPGDGRAPVDVMRMNHAELREARGGLAAMIFQEPMTSLNPVFTIGEQIIEAIRQHQRCPRRDAAARAADALAQAGITDPAKRLSAYPHEFSGGMRQRVMIAAALACRPRVLLADEPTTALDVTVQAQILSLLAEAQRRLGMAMVFITHNLGVVARIADVVCVMYAGRVVEYGSVFDVFERPLHPYTRALLSVSPGLRDKAARLRTAPEVLATLGADGMRLPDGARAWWPHASGDPHSREATLRVISPGRWAAAEPEPGDIPEHIPDLRCTRSGQ